MKQKRMTRNSSHYTSKKENPQIINTFLKYAASQLITTAHHPPHTFPSMDQALIKGGWFASHKLTPKILFNVGGVWFFWGRVTQKMQKLNFMAFLSPPSLVDKRCQPSSLIRRTKFIQRHRVTLPLPLLPVPCPSTQRGYRQTPPAQQGSRARKLNYHPDRSQGFLNKASVI